MKTTRRDFISRSVLSAAGISVGINKAVSAMHSGNSSPDFMDVPGILSPKNGNAFSISIFSKHLHWLNWTDMAKFAEETGFDGVDLTVRPQGHVEPERVEDDLPRAAEIIRKAGMDIYMITTAVTDAGDPLTEKILKTAGSLGIRHYRTGWLHYDDNKTIEDNLGLLQQKMSELARLNEKYGISGEYQNHSGTGADGIYFGGAIWDLSGILKNIHSPWLGSQYDIYHATVEGANTWPVGLKLIKPYIRTLDIKDFQWTKKDGKWIAETVPLGEGMVDFKKYFGLLRTLDITGPISIHYEYPLGGAENGAKAITMEREQVRSAMQKDLVTLKTCLREAGLKQ